MILVLAKLVVIFFAAFIISIGVIMLFNPTKMRAILRKAGSTNFINYAEITLRLIPAIALIACADASKFPLAFEVFGWIMLSTSLMLYAIPREMHHKFSMKSAELIKPFYFQLIAPFAFLFGGLILYNIV